MDFMPTTYSSFWTDFSWGLVALYVVAWAPFIIVMAALARGKFGKDKTWKGFAAFMSLVLASAAVALAPAIMGAVTQTQQYEHSIEVRAEIAETLNSLYGTDLTVGELSYYGGLEYPDERPETDFEVFGSVERDAEKAGGGFERQTIYLIWQDDELRLAESADGEVFDVLGD